MLKPQNNSDSPAYRSLLDDVIDATQNKPEAPNAPARGDDDIVASIFSLVSASPAREVLAPAPEKPEPKPEPKPETPAQKVVAPKPKGRQTFRKGDYVFYTSKRGTVKRYRVVGYGQGGSLKLQMLGHFPGDKLKGKVFYAKRSACELDSYAPSPRAGRGGGRRCTICGKWTCDIGPFERA